MRESDKYIYIFLIENKTVEHTKGAVKRVINI